jgi:hypothetical protein
VQYVAKITFGFDTANGAETGFAFKWNSLYSLGKPLHLYDAIIDDNKFCVLVRPVFVDCVKLFSVDMFML